MFVWCAIGKNVRRFAVLVENSDVALISGYMVEKFSFLQHTQTRLVVDLYFILENLHYYVNEPISAQQTFNHHAVSITA